MTRFVAIIESPTRIWTDYLVVDLVRNVCICKCADCGNAEAIASCMNIQHREREAKVLTFGGT